MLRTVIWIVVVVALCVGGWLVYKQVRTSQALGSGTVTARDGGSADSSYTLDGNAPNSDAAKPTPSRSDAPGTVNGEPVGKTTTAGPLTATPQPSPNAMAMPNAMPVADSQAANAPNDMRFGGTGRFQWYRQGNLTWRVNSATGTTCIAFATMEEWQKPIVYSHGCGNA